MHTERRNQQILKAELDRTVRQIKVEKKSDKLWTKAHRLLLQYGQGVDNEMAGDRTRVTTPMAEVGQQRLILEGEFVSNRPSNLISIYIKGFRPPHEEVLPVLSMPNRATLPLKEATRGLQYLKAMKRSLKEGEDW